MQEASFVHIIRQPALLSRYPFAEVGDWVEQHPHVAILRVMLAIKAEQTQHEQAAIYLEQAACYVPDRRKLKRLMADWRAQLAEAVEKVVDVEEAADAAAEIMATLAAMQAQKQQQEIEAEQSDVLEEKEVPAIEDAPVLVPDDHVEVELLAEEEVEQEPEATVEAEVSEDVITEEEEVAIDQGGQDIIVAEEPEAGDPVVEPEPEVHDIATESEPMPVEALQETEEAVYDLVNSKEEVQLEEALGAEVQAPDEQEEGITAEDDEVFLKAIGQWTDSPAIILPSEDEWILEAPGHSIPKLTLSDTLDAGLASSDIAWLLPFVADFDLPIPAMLSARKAVQVEVVVDVEEKEEVSSEVIPITKEPATQVAVQEEIPTVTVTDVQDQEHLESPEAQPKHKEIEQAPTFSSTHSFDEWLQILSKQKEAGGEEPAFEMPQPDYIGASDTEVPEKSEPKELAEVSESEVKKWAQESVTMQKDMASETLAKIYLQQGKLGLAIQIYQKLMERFPEKSTYFAAQIKSIKQE